MAWQICLFILLAASCSHGLDLASSRFDHIQDSIKKLETDFNTSTPDVAEGGSVFIQFLNDKGNEKKIFIAQIISMYLQMLNNATKTSPSEHVKKIIEALEHYKEEYRDSLKRANDLIQLAKLPMDDIKIQRKAVLEMYHVLQHVKKEEIRRRRRSRAQNPRIQKRRVPVFIG